MQPSETSADKQTLPGSGSGSGSGMLLPKPYLNQVWTAGDMTQGRDGIHELPPRLGAGDGQLPDRYLLCAPHQAFANLRVAGSPAVKRMLPANLRALSAPGCTSCCMSSNPVATAELPCNGVCYRQGSPAHLPMRPDPEHPLGSVLAPGYRSIGGGERWRLVLR